MAGIIHIHLPANFDRSLAPVPATRDRDWWADNTKTVNHARHCLPLMMANSLGYFILSPGTFMVRWNGDLHANCVVETLETSSHYVVDDHAAFGSFTVQPGFIPRTEKEGEYIYIKGVANERNMPYSCMEAAVEAWWSPANFGLVYLLNQPGEFLIRKGQPIAQMMIYKGEVGGAKMVLEGPHPGHAEFMARRTRPDYHKDLDYMKGLDPSGRKILSHITNWKDISNLKEEP